MPSELRAIEMCNILLNGHLLDKIATELPSLTMLELDDTLIEAAHDQDLKPASSLRSISILLNVPYVSQTCPLNIVS